jgi:hypothetical protein
LLRVFIEPTCDTLVVDGLVKSESDGRTSSNGVGLCIGCIGLCAGIATDVIAGDIGDRTVVVGVQAHILVVSSAGAVGNELSPAVVSEGSVGKGQQAACSCEVEMHGGLNSSVIVSI